MADTIDRLSSYNIFNNLLPETLFAGMGGQISPYSLVETNLLLAPFHFLSRGQVISRFGSLMVEMLLKKVGLANFAGY